MVACGDECPVSAEHTLFIKVRSSNFYVESPDFEILIANLKFKKNAV